MVTYKQIEKNIARNKLIKEAINRLTTDRNQSTLLTTENFELIAKQFLSLINLYTKKSYKSELEPTIENKIINEWNLLYNSNVPSKKASDLKVLYLSGSEPTNDLKVFLENGISPYNIWAVEHNKTYYEDAINDLRKSNNFIKIHKGSLKSFFESYPETFDIIYFDACNSLIASSNNPLDILKEIFIGKRLDSLSVLITNFSEPDEKNWGEWSKIFASWYSVRDEGIPDTLYDSTFADKEVRFTKIQEYADYISENIPDTYSDFIRRFIPVLASDIIPYLRIMSFKAVRSKFFHEDSLLNNSTFAH